MKDKFIKLYSILGVNWESNKTLIKYLDYLNVEQEKVRKTYELFHMDFIIGLDFIQKNDEHSFNRYIKTLNDTKGDTNFWGEKFEVYMHYKLLNGAPQIINNLRRGKDGLEPDLTFEFNGEKLGIELTTRQFLTPPKNETEILNKITEKILEKNSKEYANETCALIVDITNIVAYEKIFNISLNKIFKKHFSGFSYLEKEMKFGMVILVNSMFLYENEIRQILNPRLGLKSEYKEMNPNLKTFLNILFNGFKQDYSNCEEIYHTNI